MRYRSRQRRRLFATSILVLLGGCTLLLIGWGMWQQVLSPQRIPSAHQTSISVLPVQATPAPGATATPLLPVNQSPLALDDPALQTTMLDAINQDRQNNGLAPVAWDATAAAAGTLHAADMAANSYFSHWNMRGHGPEYRYNQAGGRDSVMENIFTYSYRFDTGKPAPINDFVSIVEMAQESLMNSPGHRANIVAPEHTHVGVGFAYNPETGSFYLAQEFVNRYVELQPLPLQAERGTSLQITGRLLPEAHTPTINLTYQPFPKPLSLAELNATSSYSRDVDIYAAISPEIETDDTFTAPVQLDHQGQAGVYSVRVWVTVQGQSVLASEWLIDVP